MSNIEHKSIATEIKASIDTNTFEGYASVFGNEDSYGDVIQPGAFAKTIEERKGKVRVLWNHDSRGLPIGVPTEMREDGHGLYVVAKFSQTQLAQDVRTLMSEGAVDSMSIGFSTIKSDWNEDYSIRFLRELKLFEFSPVLFPANELALITGSKGLDALERTLSQLDDMIAVGIKSGRPLSAGNLTRLQAAYKSLGELMQVEKAAEEKATVSDLPESTADQITETQIEAGEDDDVLIALKGFSLTSRKSVEDEIARALANIRF